MLREGRRASGGPEVSERRAYPRKIHVRFVESKASYDKMLVPRTPVSNAGSLRGRRREADRTKRSHEEQARRTASTV